MKKVIHAWENTRYIVAADENVWTAFCGFTDKTKPGEYHPQVVDPNFGLVTCDTCKSLYSLHQLAALKETPPPPSSTQFSATPLTYEAIMRGIKRMKEWKPWVT
jgi:hypothetical protein